jgi:hypothetical protein
MSRKIRQSLRRCLWSGILILVLVVLGSAQEKASQDQPIPRGETPPAVEKFEGVKTGEMEQEPGVEAPCPESQASPPKSKVLRKRTDRIGGQVIRGKDGEGEQK